MKKITSTVIIIALGTTSLFLIVCAGLLYKYSNYIYVPEAASDAYELIFLGLTTLFFLVLLLLVARKNLYLKLAAIFLVIGFFLCQVYFSFLLAITVTGGEGWFYLSFIPTLIFLILDLTIVKDFVSKEPKLKTETFTISFLISAVPVILIVYSLFLVPSKPYNNIIVNIKNAFAINFQNTAVGTIALPFKENPSSLIPFGGDEGFLAQIDTYTYTGMYFYWNKEVDIFSSTDGTVKEMRDHDSYKNYSFSIEGNNATILYGKLSSIDPQIKLGANAKKGQLLGRSKALYWTFANKLSNNLYEGFDNVSCPADHLNSKDKNTLQAIPMEANYARDYGNRNICGN